MNITQISLKKTDLMLEPTTNPTNQLSGKFERRIAQPITLKNTTISDNQPPYSDSKMSAMFMVFKHI